jgi:hypothetical protein
MSLLYWTVLTESFPSDVNGSQAGTLSATYSGIKKGN